MKSSLAHEMIDVDALRVGMFVHLDLSWMAHPFAVGNFRIADQGQVSTIRGLGVRRVRWSPARSDLRAPVRVQGGTLNDTAPADPASPPEPAPLPEVSAADEHRRVLEAQRASLAVCEQQFAEAAQDCKQLCSALR